MKISYKIEGLDCPICVSGLEEKLSELDGIDSFNLSLMTGRLNLVINDENSAEIIKNIKHTVETFEDGLSMKRV